MTRLRWTSVPIVVGVLLGLRGEARPEGATAATAGGGLPPSITSPAPTSPASAPGPSGKRSHEGFFLRLALGTVYLHESWRPSGGSPRASHAGLGTSLDTSIGRSVLRPGVIVGGRWQLAAFVDPGESFAGATYHLSLTARFLNVVAAFVDYYPDPRRGLHLGGGVGIVAATNLDAGYGVATTSWGPAISAGLGYERFISSRWSVGVIAQICAYRYFTTEAGISSVSSGLSPTLALAFTLN